MAEQGSDSANTGASGAELVRQLLDRTTLRARKEGARQGPGCLLPGGAIALGQSWSGRAAVRAARPAGYTTARGTCGLPAVRCQLTTEEVRQ